MYSGFASWSHVLFHVDTGVQKLVYHAPMDPSPTLVRIVKRFRNGKLRLVGPSGIEFTADKGHLSRVYRAYQCG